MTPEFYLQLAATLAGAVAVYAAIRTDIAILKVRVEHLEKRISGG